MSGSVTHGTAKTIYTATDVCYITGTFSCGVGLSGKPGYSNQAWGASGYIKIYNSDGILKETLMQANSSPGNGTSTAYGSFTTLLDIGDRMDIYAYGVANETDKNYTSYAYTSVSGTVISIAID